MTQKNQSPPSKGQPENKGLIILSLTLFILLCLFSFDMHAKHKNILGLIGYGTAFSLNYLFGLTSYLVVFYLGWMGWTLLCHQKIDQGSIKHIYFGCFLISWCVILNVLAELNVFIPSFIKKTLFTESLIIDFPYPHKKTRYNLGGVPVYWVYKDLAFINLQKMLGDVGAFITFSITGTVSFVLWCDIKIHPLIMKIKRKIWDIDLSKVHSLFSQTKPSNPVAIKKTQNNLKDIENKLKSSLPSPFYSPEKIPSSPIFKGNESFVNEKEDHYLKEIPQEEILEDKKLFSLTKKQEAIVSQQVYNGDFTHYHLPPLSLLKNPKKVDNPSLKKDLRKQAEILEETLMSFGIEAKVGEIHCGPTITSFEVHPAVGVKVQKITALENDIALNLQAKSIRIIAPIPGKAAVGIETPSLYPQEVSFKEMLSHYQQQSRKMMIPVILGKTVTGDHVISDMAKMPHCIIAGATGSGKSVCINTLIMSILMNARPDEIKLLMIDPKKVELTPYTSLPHMIAPVITEPHGAYAALSWLVKEMQTRYDILKQLGLRNITAFNSRTIDEELEQSLNMEIPKRMYAIVAIIDEFADLMMVSSSDLETPIARIAQMARAVGIHLVLATQRPSREVITGLIKANFPTRIAFKVASRINSQIILDETGAETLLGNGDMLFLPPGSSVLVRAQGAYISDDEINKIVSFICDQAPPNYLISSFDQMKKEEIDPSVSTQEEGSRDSLYSQALSIVLDTKTASTTFLQRKLKIGYARAASLMDELEQNGIIGPQEGSKPRKVLAESGPPSLSEDFFE
ncbi:MAG: DNA translocase FtsK 4TM domain-containing protein [Rhabdochlamydiaceae bacterium]